APVRAAGLQQVVILDDVAGAKVGELGEPAFPFRHQAPRAVVVASPGGESHAWPKVESGRKAGRPVVARRPAEADRHPRVLGCPGTGQAASLVAVPGEGYRDVYLAHLFVPRPYPG